MAATCGRWPRIGLLVAGLLLLGATGVRADDPNPLREELLKLNSAATEDVQSAKLRALLKDRAKAKKAVAEAVKMVKEAKDKDSPFNYNGTLILASVAHKVREYDAAERFYEQLVEVATKLNSGTKIATAYEGLIDVYWDAKRYAVVVETCEKALDLTAKDVEAVQVYALERMIQAKAKQGKFDEAFGMLKGVLELQEDSYYFLETKGWVQREQGKFDDAIKTYTEVLDKLDANKTLKAESKDKLKDRVRYTLSGVYLENKDIDKAVKQLQILVQRNPDDAGYKNDLGFLWCDHDLKLEEAEKLIREALELDKKEQEQQKKDGKIDEVKENAAYLDSLAWVLYKQKKYKEALPLLKKAAADEDEGNHLEIWDHLGDVHLALGEKKEAIAAWEKALKMDDISKRDGERRRKLSEKLKKARAE